ncbi:MAG: hypothetical protein E7Z84_05105 [Methanosphaera stadtmanae]|nr:hypothetical protein [Methanosphaera stadtmanae]
MKKVVLIIVSIIILLFVGVFIGYLMDNNGKLNDNDALLLGINQESTVKITLSTTRPRNINELIHDIKTMSYYEGYNNDTINWMQTLNQTETYPSDKGFIIMDKRDAQKIKVDIISDIDTTDVYTEYYIECKIVENHSLDSKKPVNILLVKDVKYLGNKTFSHEI